MREIKINPTTITLPCDTLHRRVTGVPKRPETLRSPL